MGHAISKIKSRTLHQMAEETISLSLSFLLSSNFRFAAAVVKAVIVVVVLLGIF